MDAVLYVLFIVLVGLTTALGVASDFFGKYRTSVGHVLRTMFSGILLHFLFFVFSFGATVLLLVYGIINDDMAQSLGKWFAETTDDLRRAYNEDHNTSIRSIVDDTKMQLQIGAIMLVLAISLISFWVSEWLVVSVFRNLEWMSTQKACSFGCVFFSMLTAIIGTLI